MKHLRLLSLIATAVLVAILWYFFGPPYLIPEPNYPDDPRGLEISPEPTSEPTYDNTGKG